MRSQRFCWMWLSGTRGLMTRTFDIGEAPRDIQGHPPVTPKKRSRYAHRQHVWIPGGNKMTVSVSGN